MARDYDGKHIIAFAKEHEQVQEGWQHMAWIELKGGIATDSFFHGVAATKVRATELAYEQAAAAIDAGKVRYSAQKEPT